MVISDITERKQADEKSLKLLGNATESRRTLLSVVEDQKLTEESLREAEKELKAHRDDLEKLVHERTSELRQVIQMMSGREIRMGELKRKNLELKVQLQAAQDQGGEK